jgi:plastocyanin
MGGQLDARRRTHPVSLGWSNASVAPALLLFILGAAAPAPQASSASASGTLQGQVTVGEKLWERRLKFSLYPDLRRASHQSQPDGSDRDELQNVIVHATRSGQPSAATLPAGRRAVMAQREGEFVPHVLPVLVGSEVEFPNSDPVFHNVFSLSRAATFDLGRYPKGDSRSVRFDEPGLVKVYCHIHSDMSASIMVLDSPLFAVPDESGHYRIDGMPPGDYEIRAWHERARPIVRTIRIRPGEATTVDFTIPLSQAVEHEE